jgi:hypothetical protein
MNRRPFENILNWACDVMFIFRDFAFLCRTEHLIAKQSQVKRTTFTRLTISTKQTCFHRCTGHSFGSVRLFERLAKVETLTSERAYLQVGLSVVRMRAIADN